MPGSSQPGQAAAGLVPGQTLARRGQRRFDNKILAPGEGAGRLAVQGMGFRNRQAQIGSQAVKRKLVM